MIQRYLLPSHHSLFGVLTVSLHLAFQIAMRIRK